MNFGRTWALIERDLRKFFRSPALMMTSMIFPLMQLIVLGYAFGGKVTGVTVAFVDVDQSAESQKIREMFNGIAAGPRTFHVIDYDSIQKADEDLRTVTSARSFMCRRIFRSASTIVTGRGLPLWRTTPTSSFRARF
jgi:hypothetical protein